MKTLTKQQIKRQDFVDNEVFELIQRLAPSAKMKWDIEVMGTIRDEIRKQIVGKKFMSEMKFYPYIKI